MLSFSRRGRTPGRSRGRSCGHLIPAGTGLREFEKIIVGSKEEYERMQANRKNVLDYVQESVLDD